jgi:putative endonuclease
MWYVYILLCSDNTLYTGATNDVDKRFITHKNGKGGQYTRTHKPVKIVYRQEFATRSEALKCEYEIKQWPRLKKIAKLKLSL